MILCQTCAAVLSANLLPMLAATTQQCLELDWLMLMLTQIEEQQVQRVQMQADMELEKSTVQQLTKQLEVRSTSPAASGPNHPVLSQVAVR